MIKKIFTILLFLILCHGFAEAGQKIIAIQSMRVKPYEEALIGFQNVCDSKIKRLIISELEGVDVVNKINKIEPDLILAIGADSLSMVKTIKNIPVVYLMVLNPEPIVSGAQNVTGVSMNINQEKQLMIISKALPDIRNIGLIYDPNRTGYLVKRAQETARKIGIKLFAEEIHNSRVVPSLINHMKGKIDAFWMLPDITVITPEIVEFLLLFSLENKIPILTFSEKYIELGALMSIGIDPFDMGRQAGKIAKKILSGRDVNNVKRVDARKAVISINLKVARKLGMNINKEIIRKAHIID